MEFISFFIPLVFSFIFLFFVPRWTYKFILSLNKFIYELINKDFDE